MATLLHIEVPDPQNVIDTYDDAVMRIERDTSSAMDDATELFNFPIVAGKTEYEVADSTGIAGTHWYRVRYSTGSPAVPSDYSGYGPVFQAGSPGGEVITLEQSKTWQDIPDTVDDAALRVIIGACNRRAIDLIGVDIGPTPETVRLYHGDAAFCDGTELPIPGGIRSFTTVELTFDGGTTWVDVTVDVYISPETHERPFGHPGGRLVFRDIPTTGYSRFPRGRRNVRVTALPFVGFAWDAYPPDLVHLVTSRAQRMARERDGENGYVNEATVAHYIPDDDPICRSYRRLYFPAAG